VIGAHTPEFSFEKQPENVENALRELKITYPIAIDSDYAIWRAFNNQYWPAQYLIDGKERIRFHHFGEGDYEGLERVIQDLLRQNGSTGIDGSTVSTSATGVEAAPDFENQRSPENPTSVTVKPSILLLPNDWPMTHKSYIARLQDML